MVGCCPFHSEETPSFKIHVEDQFFKCFGCGESGDVFSWLSLRKYGRKESSGDAFSAIVDDACKLAGLNNDRKPVKPREIFTKDRLRAAVEYSAAGKGQHIADVYEYTHPESGKVELCVFRLEGPNGKEFKQCCANGDGFSFGGLTRNPIFNRSRLKQTETVVIVEGEKCVKVLHRFEIIATTSPGGANGAKKADWTPLAGKTIVFWRDSDDNGYRFQAETIEELERLEPRPRISIVDVDRLELSKGGDCVDFIERCKGDRFEICSLITEVLVDAVPTGTVGRLEAELRDAMSGKRYCVPFIWDTITRATNALLPGTVTLFAGGPGSTKSFGLVQLARYWIELSHKVAVLMLEDGDVYHLRRMFGQIVGGNITNDTWVARPENHAQVNEWMKANRAVLEVLSKSLESPPDASALTVEWLLDWIKTRCEAGNRIVCIDPITAMEKGQLGFNDDRKFMMGAKRIIERHKASLVLVTHTRKNQPGQKGASGMGDLAGGVAYERFAHTILHIKSHEERTSTVETTMGQTNATTNRTLDIWKARNSWGERKIVSMFFDSEFLSLHERGIWVDNL